MTVFHEFFQHTFCIHISSHLIVHSFTGNTTQRYNLKFVMKFSLCAFYFTAVIVPHIGSATTWARNEMCILTARNIIAALDDQPMPAEVLWALRGACSCMYHSYKIRGEVCLKLSNFERNVKGVFTNRLWTDCASNKHISTEWQHKSVVTWKCWQIWRNSINVCKSGWWFYNINVYYTVWKT